MNAKQERGHRLIAEGTRLLVEGTIEATGPGAENVTPKSCAPFKWRALLELARDGKLPSTKVGGKVVIRRADLEAYIDREGLRRGKAIDDQDVSDEVEDILKAGARR
jgi:hypothetical protein